MEERQEKFQRHKIGENASSIVRHVPCSFYFVTMFLRSSETYGRKEITGSAVKLNEMDNKHISDMLEYHHYHAELKKVEINYEQNDSTEVCL